MPEHLRALVVILVLAVTVFKLAERPLTAAAISLRDYRRRRNLWFAITLIAFFSHNFWVYLAVAGAVIFHFGRRDRNPFALYCMLIFAVPPFGAPLPTLGVVNYLFDINHLQLLNLTLLLPAAWRLARAPRAPTTVGRVTDWMIGSYFVLIVALTANADGLSATVVMRTAVVTGLDILLCYYVASRSLASREALRETLATFVVSGVLMAAMAMFEFVRGWLLYSSLDESMGLSWAFGSYMMRGAESLRAMGSTGHSIILGYVMAVCGGLLIYLRVLVPQVGLWRLAALAVGGALACSLSRGPWVGAAAGLLLGVGIGPGASRRVMKFMIIGTLIGGVMLMTPLGPKILKYLPFVGDLDDSTISYRQELFRVSLLVIRQNPWFGTFDALSNPLMEQLRQGEGIIDTVNSYIVVALSYGIVGLTLFSGAFLTAGWSVWRLHRRFGRKDDPEAEHLARALLAVLAAIMITIATASPISAIPPVYWSMIGVAVAYARWRAAMVADAVPLGTRFANRVPRPGYRMRTAR
jgi:O-antigen ligase